MALKRKITKAEYDELPEVIKAEYKGDGAGYVLDTDDDNEAVETLRRSLQNSRNDTAAEKESKRQLQERLDEIDRKIRAGELTEAQANKDVDALTRLYTEERETLRTELTGVISKKDKQLENLLLAGKAESIARKLSGDNWALLLPHVSCRLRADVSADVPSVKVVTSTGEASTLSLDDLEKELLNNPLYAAILVGVNSSGGGASRQAGGGASKQPHEYTAAERNELFKNNRAEFDRIFAPK